MKRLFSLVVILILGFSLVGRVRAQEGDLGFIPDPESKIFGLQMAWMRLTENWQRIRTLDEEKLTELELRIAEREQVLLERIDAVSESNLDLAEKLQNRFDDLQQGNEERLNYIGTRVDKIRIKQEALEGYQSSWADQMTARREYLLEQREELRNMYQIHQEEMMQNREEVQERVQERVNQTSAPNPTATGEPLRIRE